MQRLAASDLVLHFLSMSHKTNSSLTLYEFAYTANAMVKSNNLLIDTSVTSLGRQFDFNDVDYQVQPCNVYKRRRYIGFTTNGRSKHT